MQVVVAVTGDLMARARLEDAAARAGARLEIASLDSVGEKIRTVRAGMLLLDLDAGREKLLARIDELRIRGSLPPRVIGFVSHVDADLAGAARAAGCDVVPRGRFWRTLPQLLGGEALD